MFRTLHVRCLTVSLAVLVMAGAGFAYAYQEPSKPRRTLGLVLSGGGARGLAHIGVLKVMEEAGLRPDYITGTSMGAVVGSLYALGYSARELEAIITAQNLPALLQDQVARGDLSLDDKEDLGKYLGSFPIRRGRVTLPTGLISGQNVSLLLSRLLLPARHIRDFHRLPVPFECLATDIETGKAVILDHGYLPEAVRASLAIPTLFTPVELDGRLLVDGGLVTDLPVANVLAMGADVVVAVDVNSHLAKRNRLDSLPKILDQALLIFIQDSNRKQAENSHLTLRPDPGEIGLMTFDQARAAIARGEAAARERWPELQALARELGREPGREGADALRIPADRPCLDQAAESLLITDIEVEGLQQVPKELVLGKLGLAVPASITCRRIEEAVQRVYGSRYFQRVTYRFRPADGGEVLVIRVTENISDVFQFGAHYDTDLNAMLLLNATFRELLGRSSEIRLDAYLSKYAVLNASYLLQTDWQPRLGLEADLNYQSGGLALYNVDEVEAYIDQTYWKADVLARSSLSNAVSAGVGLEKEVTLANSALVSSGATAGSVESLNYLAFLAVDNLDRNFFPRRGWKIKAEVKWVSDHLPLRPQEPFPGFTRALLTATHVMPLHPNISLAASLYGGATLGETVNPAQWFFVGGQTFFQRNTFPFLGMRNIEGAGPNVLIAHLGLQFEPWESKYLILRANVGRTGSRADDIFRTGELRMGYGITAGAATLLGPVEATVMAGRTLSSVAGFISIGYPF